MPHSPKDQDHDLIAALDIGTRSIVGMLGRVESGRLRVLAIEKAEHHRRSMNDGQIEDIGAVTALAKTVLGRLEDAMGIRLRRICVAAAGRALKSQRASFSLSFDSLQRIDDDLVAKLETGAISEAEALVAMETSMHRFYLVGYTVSQYRLDGYPLSTLIGHNGREISADVVATFLPAEVVESLYAVVHRLGLEVASLILEPIASLNAAIPSQIRLLNLVLADIGAGTSDIAICRDGSVVGYTMATIAGDEVTEHLMRELLCDFNTAEALKMNILSQESFQYTDVLGSSHTITALRLRELVYAPALALADEIAAGIVDVNGGPPSAVFLAGGGSKLVGLRELIAERLGMDLGRVAIAGSNFEQSAFSDDHNLNDPEYSTPLGIAVSTALGLVHDSCMIILNGRPAKLFRSGSLSVRDVLLMNGYTYADIIGRTGQNLMVTVNGKRRFFPGEASSPAVMKLNGEDTALSAVVTAGDHLTFTPAVSGRSARATVLDVVGEDFRGLVTVNGAFQPLCTEVSSGDVLVATPDEPEVPAPEAPPASPDRGDPDAGDADHTEGDSSIHPTPDTDPGEAEPLYVTLNDYPLILPPKESGAPYYLMDLLEKSGLDFQNLGHPVRLLVNGADSMFSRVLEQGDVIQIREESMR